MPSSRTRAPGPLLTARSRAGLVRWQVSSANWTAPPLRIAFLSDFHAARPWTTLADLSRAAAQAMDQNPDLVILGGDFLAGPLPPALRFPAREIVGALADLSAPLGVFAILGNHDWKDCALAAASGLVRNSVVEALADSPYRLLRNEAVALGDTGAWLVGLDSQRPFGLHRATAFHDPALAFAAVPAGAPAILAAHEPDVFADGNLPAVLQLSGHTHAGQVNLFGWKPATPSLHGGRYAWGHHRDGGRHLVVSGGVGFSGLPLRFAAPPEITLVELSGATTVAPS
jgi:predicted MPP superfamily phosphohydrolase